MKTETFKTVLAMIAQDPLTDRQRDTLGGLDGDEVIDNETAAEMLGVSPQVMRRLDVPRIRVNRYLRYRKADVRRYRDMNTH